MLEEENYTGLFNQTVEDFNLELQEKGVMLWLDKGSLRYKAPKGAVTGEMLKSIGARRDELVRYLSNKARADIQEDILYAPIAPVEEKEYYPLSSAQKRMFVLNQLDRENTAYNITNVLKIEGEFQEDRLVEALKQLTCRHESLRTTFETVEGRPVQKIHERVDFIPEFMETDGNEEDIDHIDNIIKEFVRPYDLSRLPLFRLGIVRPKARDKGCAAYILFDIHHIISDGVSASILVKEINALYEGRSLPGLKVRYRDYAAWQGKLLAEERTGRQREFWRKQLEGEIPVLDMPCDYPRPVKFNPEGESIYCSLGSELTYKLNSLARENRVTLFNVLLSAYYVLLSKYSGQTDIVVGTPAAGRVHEDTYGIVGIFLNTLALRNYPLPGRAFADFLKEVAKNAIKVFDNQDYPFERLVEDLNTERDTGRNPVFSTMFVLQNMDMDEVKAGGMKSSPYKIKHKMSQLDITVNAEENEKGIDIEINYCTHLFNRDSMERFAKHFANILNFVANNPQAALSGIDMLSEEEKKQSLYGFNTGRDEYGTETTLHALFEKQAERTPEAAAVIIGDEKISYGALNRKANRLAGTLIKKGAKPDEIIAVLTEPSIETAVAILGILKAGGAYLPISTDLPEERVKYLLEDSGAKMALTQTPFISRIKAGVEIVDINDEAVYSDDESDPGKTCGTHDLAYVIYTSGTTGNPKGVLIEHHSIARTLQWRADEYGLSAEDCVLQLFSYSFDGFLTGFFTPLISGAGVVLLKKGREKDPHAIRSEIAVHGVTHFISVPVLYSAILEGTGPGELESLRVVTLAGDKAAGNLIRKSTEMNPGLELVNEYGPTESSVVAAIYRNMREDTNSVIGRPVPGTGIYILNGDGQLQPAGVPGELCISGGRLARGYLNRPDLTAQKFIENPYKPGERLYKTGDAAKWLPDGNIVFMGRMDHQVKIRGYRIEPAEIEQELLKHEAVKEAVVLDRSREDGNRYLCAYVVPGRDFTVTELRDFLLRALPEYMLPAKFVRLESMPISSGGKVDRKALPQPDESADTGIEFIEPVNKTEKELAGVWEELLGVKNIGVNHSFFELGGDSMSIVELHSRLEKLYPGVLTVADLFSCSTISKLAAYIENSGKNEREERAGNAGGQPGADGEGLRDIAIIGISVNLPLAGNTGEFWDNIKNRVDCVREMPEGRKPDADAFVRVRKPGVDKPRYEELAYLDEIDKFDCNFFGITPKEAGLMDPNQRLFLQTVWRAIEDGGYGGDRLKGTRTGVYVGFAGESEYGRAIADTMPESYAVAVAGNLTSVIAGRISYILDLKGPGILVNTACSSSLAAVHYACAGIKSGECDMAVAGGVKIWPASLKNEFQMGIESGDSRTKTFDDNSDGTAKGEGVAAILLKPLKKAIEDRDPIYAVIKGSSVNQDGASNGITAPNPAAQAEVISRAWENAGIDPETMGYIEAHGTGTKLGDPIEIDGIRKAFRKYTSRNQFCAVSSVKSNLGHLDNAAGIVGIVKAALALKNRELPPSLHFRTPNGAIDFIGSPVYVNDRSRKWETDGSPRRCGVSSFGMSGTNCHIVMEEAPVQKQAEREDGEKLNVMAISAATKESLLELIGAYSEKYGERAGNAESEGSGALGDRVNHEDLCYTLNTGRGHYAFRAAAVLEPGESLAEKLSGLRGLIEGTYEAPGTFYGECPRQQPGHTAALSMGTSREKQDYNQMAAAKAGAFLNSGKRDREILYEICQLYVKGADINWENFYSGEKPGRLNAPAYPFMRKRCWFDLPVQAKGQGNAEGNLYYGLSWDKKELGERKGGLSQKNVLVVSDSHEIDIYEELITGLESRVKTLTTAVKGGGFEETGSGYTVGTQARDYDSLCRHIEHKGIHMVVYLSMAGGNKTNFMEETQDSQVSGAIGLLHLTKSLGSILKDKIELVVVCDNVNEVTGRESRINPGNAIVLGIGKSIGLEYQNIRCRLVDMDEKTGAGRLVEELESGGEDYQAAYRNNVRYADVIRRVDTGCLADYETEIKTGGVYLITGGTGRLGLEAAKYLASKGKVKLALVGRRPIPGKRDWDQVLKANSGNKICDVIEAVRHLENWGAEAECYSCDITSEKELEKLLTVLRNKFGRINGIIHCAAVGVGSSGIPIREETEESFREVLLPKVRGTWLLDRLTRQDRPDFFIMYSSGITLTGGVGSCSYTAANSYLDSFAAKRAAKMGRTLALNWPVWENESLKNIMDENKLMFKMLPAQKAMAALDELLQKNISRVIVGEMNFDGNILSEAGHLPFRLSGELNSMAEERAAARRKAPLPEELAMEYQGTYLGARDRTEEIIAAICRDVLGFERVGIDQDFFELGGHSLLAVEFISKLDREFHKNITLQCLFENPTVEKLARIFREDLQRDEDVEFEEIQL